jgi:hypothetical protein
MLSMLVRIKWLYHLAWYTVPAPTAHITLMQRLTSTCIGNAQRATYVDRISSNVGRIPLRAGLQQSAATVEQVLDANFTSWSGLQISYFYCGCGTRVSLQCTAADSPLTSLRAADYLSSFRFATYRRRLTIIVPYRFCVVRPVSLPNSVSEFFL